MRRSLQEVEGTDADLALMLGAHDGGLRDVSEPLAPELDAAEAALAAHPNNNSLGGRLMAGTLTIYRAMAGRRRSDVLEVGVRALGDDAAYSTDLDAGYPHMFAIMGLGASTR